MLPSTPAPGLVEFDANELAEASLGLARDVLAKGGPVQAVGVTNQRASTILWDRATGEPVGPGLGWQDLRTVGDCLGYQAEGLRLAPNLSATKVCHLLNEHDPDRSRDLCFGTVDSWIVWKLTDGALHVTDPSNAAVTGLINRSGTEWDRKVLALLRIPESALPAVVDSSGMIGEATALDGRTADHRNRGRPTGIARGTGLRSSRPGQDHVRDRRHAGCRRRTAAPDLRHSRQRRNVSDHRVAS